MVRRILNHCAAQAKFRWSWCDLSMPLLRPSHPCSPFKKSYTGQAAAAAQWTGDTLQLREGGQAAQQAFLQVRCALCCCWGCAGCHMLFKKPSARVQGAQHGRVLLQLRTASCMCVLHVVQCACRPHLISCRRSCCPPSTACWLERSGSAGRRIWTGSGEREASTRAVT